MPSERQTTANGIEQHSDAHPGATVVRVNTQSVVSNGAETQTAGGERGKGSHSQDVASAIATTIAGVPLVRTPTKQLMYCRHMVCVRACVSACVLVCVFTICRISF